MTLVELSGTTRFIILFLFYFLFSLIIEGATEKVLQFKFIMQLE